MSQPFFYKEYTYNDARFGAYNFYIHRHMDNIGRMSGKNNVTPSDIEHEYNKIRKEKNSNNESIVSSALKQQYIDLLKNKIKGNKGIDSYFAKIEQEGIGEYSDSLVKAINQHIEQSLRSNMSAEYIANLIQNSNKIDWNFAKLDLQKPLKELNQSKVLSQIDHIIENINNGVGLLKGIESADKGLFEAFINLLKETNPKNFNNSNDFGKSFLTSLQDFKTNMISNKTNDVTTVEALSSLISELSIIARQLAQGLSNITINEDGSMDLSKGKDLTFQALKNTFDKEILPIGIGETGAGLAFNLVANNLQECFVDMSKSTFKTTGKTKSFLEIRDPEVSGAIIEKFQGDVQQDIKTDITEKNTKMHIWVTGRNNELYELKFLMDLGLSVKTYRTQKVFGDKGWGNEKVDIGNGMVLGAAIIALPIDNYIKYLGFNAIAFRRYKTMKSAYQEIKKVAFIRSILYMFSSRNSKDFAQLLIVNGMMVSIWDIINYVLNNIDKIMSNPGNAAVSFKIINENSKDSQQENLSFKKNKENLEEFNQEEMITRIKNINQNINKMKMTGKISPRKVLNFAGKI